MSEPQVTQGEQGSGSTQGDQGSQGNSAGNSGANNSAGAGQNNSAGAAHTANPSFDISPLMTTLAALPEQIAKSVKEAVGTPAKPQAAPPAESAANAGSSGEGTGGKGSSGESASKETSGTNKPTGEPGKRKSFSDWWFNG